MVAQYQPERLELTQTPELAQPYDDACHTDESLLKSQTPEHGRTIPFLVPTAVHSEIARVFLYTVLLYIGPPSHKSFFSFQKYYHSSLLFLGK